MLLSLYIVNKAGGLIYQQDLAPAEHKLSGNEYLRMASTFHSMHAIASQIAPAVGCRGIERLETDTFTLQCMQTQTGVKLFVLATPGTPDLPGALHNIYELYVDYALKNPFYELEMPVRCELFDRNLAQYVQRFNTVEARR